MTFRCNTTHSSWVIRDGTFVQAAFVVGAGCGRVWDTAWLAPSDTDAVTATTAAVAMARRDDLNIFHQLEEYLLPLCHRRFRGMP